MTITNVISAIHIEQFADIQAMNMFLDLPSWTNEDSRLDQGRHFLTYFLQMNQVLPQTVKAT